MYGKSKVLVTWLVALAFLVSCGAPTAVPPTAAPPTAAPPGGGEASPVAPEEKVTITWATLAGFYTDWAEEVSKEFEEQTGHTVVINKIEYPNMYEKEVLDVLSGTGAYDILTWNVSWKAEFAENGYVIPLDEYLAATDPEEYQFDDLADVEVRTGGLWKGKIYGLPYYTFTPSMMYRCDLLEDPGEMAAFKAQYGYDLDTAFLGTTTYQNFHDVAEFFTRAEGETLKGEVLDHDFYGIGLMAGRHTQNADEIFTIAWTYGGDVLNIDGSPAVAEPEYIKAMHTYVDDLLPFAPPGSLSGSYDFVVGQFRSNLIAITGPFYLDQWPNAVKMEVEVPGSELCIGGLPAGGETWAGPFTLGINSASKHPDAAWQFLKWITGPEAQRKFALGGGSTVRLSILNDPEVYARDRNLTGHFPALADVLEHAGRCWYTNFLWTSFDAKIYEESAQWHSAANSGQMSVEEAMQGYADRITEICEGNCPLVLEGVPQPEANCEYSFDASLQMRKP